jgi:alanine-synthesizing transaminase
MSAANTPQTGTESRIKRPITKSSKLGDVFYDIRGPILQAAEQLEAEGNNVLKLNIGNPAPWGFEAPEEILRDVVRNIPNSLGYSDSKGLFSARKAIMQYCQKIQIDDVDVEDIYIGNGVSELVAMSMQAMINDGDEILIPSPDFPLWSAAVNLCGGTPVHYLCDEDDEWQPDLADIKSKITTNTRGIVVINPNNPTGAVYQREMLLSLVGIARENDLVIFADEIYDKILFDDEEYIPMASLANDLLFLTFSGLSKSYRVAGFRTGWLIVSGDKERASDYVEGLNILASLRLCSNVPTQHAIQTALGGYQSIDELTMVGGRLHEQRNVAWQRLNEIDGISCTKPKGALYLFPKIDTKKFNIVNDEQFILDFLLAKKVLLVQGSGFNWRQPDHFRVVFLPHVEQLHEAMNRLEDFLKSYQQ